MNTAAADRIAKAVLYEGYMLYPYRPSAVKNQQRFNFGVVYPQAFSEAQKGTDPWTMQAECLVQGAARRRGWKCVSVFFSWWNVRWKSCRANQVAMSGPRSFVRSESHGRRADASIPGRKRWSANWQIPAADLESFSPSSVAAPVPIAGEYDGRGSARHAGRSLAGRIVRTQYANRWLRFTWPPTPVADNVFKIVVRVQNVTPMDDAAHVSRESALHAIAGLGTCGSGR